MVGTASGMAHHYAGFVYNLLLLRALRTNTSVKHLALYFEGIPRFESTSIISHTFASLGGNNLQHLKILTFEDCGLRDNDIDLLIRATTEGGDYSHLRSLSFCDNELEPPALHCLASALTPAKFPRLEALDVSRNDCLLNDGDVTKHFVQQVVSAQGSTIKELDVSWCRDMQEFSWDSNYTYFINALTNHNTRLVSLDVTYQEPSTDDEKVDDEEDDDEECDGRQFRDELVTSLPDMKNIAHLQLHAQVCHNNDHELIAAFSKNASILKLSLYDADEFYDADEPPPRFVAVLKRNNYMVQVRQMLCSGTATANATSNTITYSIPPPIPRSLWPRVLAKVGGGSYGASPAFMILQARLAGWPESNIIKRSSTSANEMNRRTTTATATTASFYKACHRVWLMGHWMVLLRHLLPRQRCWMSSTKTIGNPYLL
jgi:hypothetical protein